MTDKEYAAALKKIKARLDYWFKPLGFGWFDIEIMWRREYKSDSRETYAAINADWQYRQAWLYIYVPAMQELSDDRIDNVLLHELSHMLVAGMTPKNSTGGETVEQREIVEYTTETVARSLLYAYQHGWNKALDYERARTKKIEAEKPHEPAVS